MQVLSLNKINKQIKDKIILKDISFTLEEGEILGLLGPNGAGKTSMMKIISGLSRANSGKLDILGIDADKERTKIKYQLVLSCRIIIWKENFLLKKLCYIMLVCIR